MADEPPIARDVTERRRSEEALRESEAAARALFEQNPVAMWVWDPETLVPFDVNEAALKQYGYTREEFLARSLLDLRPEEERQRFRDTVASAPDGADELTYFGPWRHLHKDGSELSVDVWSRALDWKGRRARVSIGIDVTDRLQAETALKDAEQRYRQLVDSMPACVSLETMGTQEVLYVGPRVEALLGYPLQDWYSGAVRWRDVVHADDREWVLAASDEIEGSPAPFGGEYRLVAADGRTVWVRDETVPVPGRPGEPGAWLGFWVDITEQKEAGRALREAEERYRALVEALPAVVWLEHIDPPGMDYMSPRVVEMLGYPLQEWHENTLFWRDIIHPEDKEQLLADYQELIEHPRPYVKEFRVLASDGRTVWLRDQAAPIADEQGVFRRWQGFWLDITEQRETERALKRAEDERRALLARLVAAGEAERSRLAEDLHDAPIQNLTAAQLRLESLRDRTSGEDLALFEKSLEAVTASIRSLRSMMFDLQPRTLDRDGLEATLRAHLMTLSEDAGMDVAIRSTLESEPPAAARSILYRIAQEALSNARKHAHAARVEVGIERAENGYRIRIEDDGVGFDADAQVAPGHSGLAAMRDRVELSGGHLTVSPGPAGGTVVVVWVPGDAGGQAGGSA